MAFKVSYRGNNGAQQSIIIDAASRPQLFAELQKRGISAIRVEETTGKPKKAKPSPSTPSARKPSPLRGLLAGLLVISLAVAAWFYLLPTLEQVKAKKDKKPSLIAEVAPEIAEPTQEVEEEPVAVPDDPNWKYEDGRKLPKDAYKDERGVWRHPGGQRVYDETAPVTTHKYKPKVLFKHRSENMIGGLLSIRPGSAVAGTEVYNHKAFLEDFLESCKEPVEYLDTDTPQERALKQEVELVKQELLERFRNGEDIAEILSETRSELQRLGEVSKLMQDEVRNALRDGSLSDEDVEDYVRAANIVLESKGANPISINPLSVSNIRLHMREYGHIVEPEEVQ